MKREFSGYFYAILLALIAMLLYVVGCSVSPKAIQQPHNVKGPLAAIGTHDPRVAFMGDFQTWTWITAVQANHPLWINDATNAPETTASMLARFPDVLAQKPDVINFIAGLGDVEDEQAGGPAFLPCSDPNMGTCSNLAAMVAQAHAAGIYVIVGTIPIDPMTGAEGPAANEVFNFDDWLLGGFDNFGGEGFPGANAFVNYEDDLPAGWTDDGVTPNAVGINVLTTAAVVAVQDCQCGGVR